MRRRIRLLKWPNFFIVGVEKSGTTSLYYYLKSHPQIFMPSRKELHYFTPNIGHKDKEVISVKTKSEYLALFQDFQNEIAIGEASADYFHDPDSSKLIHEIIPDAKIIIILRDPIERAFSAYSMNRSRRYESLSFYEAIKRDWENLQKGDIIRNLIYPGFYSQHIKRYLDLFGEKQIKIIIFEEFIKNIETTVYEVLDFLGIEEYHNFEPIKYNPYRIPRKGLLFLIIGTPVTRKLTKVLVPNSFRKFIRSKLEKVAKKPPIDENSIELLRNIYHSDLKILESLLGFSLPWKTSKL